MITYTEMLEKIKNQENHLLIANGFNRGLGINTSYSAIFDKMIENKSIYKDVQSLFIQCECDLEVFLGKLEAHIIDNLFLTKYIKNNIKLDFMSATHEIVKSQINNIYAENNEGIFLLLKNFTNFFTLNYDSSLYIFLLKYKSIDSTNDTIVLMPTLNFIEEDYDIKVNSIYSEIKKARETGTLKITLGNENNNVFEKSLGKLTKAHFITEVKAYSKSNGKKWKDKDIRKVVDIILKEESNNKILKNVDDGFLKQMKLFDNRPEYVFENRETQNLFFLHGAFHIYKDGKSYKKITQQTDKALYDRLEDILNNEEQDVVCVFQQENKIDAINENGYLLNCLNKLETLSGNIVIIGCSLADNDNHIFTKINNSRINTVYVSALREEEESIRKKAESFFPQKCIFLFNAETISYEKPIDEG